MRMLPFLTFLVLLLISATILHADNKHTLSRNDSTALEGIIVEVYHVADASDYADTTGGKLPEGSVTYRIYVDMKPDYTLQVVYGNAVHELRMATTTTFYNNSYCGALVGYNVNWAKINRGAYALDSWITLNSATNRHAGILKADDNDGSIIDRPDFSHSDGLTNGNLPEFKPFNIDMNFFNWTKNPSIFSTKNGGWAAISGTVSGTKGPTPDNRVLIAQLTTTGKLSFELNVQLGTPGGGTVNFVARNPEGTELKGPGLVYAN
jgi:hypothetical protein